jgi:N6-L-threonylcarbamoyladenine synthase
MSKSKKIILLGIETSCDETAISIIETNGNLEKGAKIRVLSNSIISQIEIHKPYGGVFPALAKREHARNLTPMLEQTLTKAGLFHPHPLRKSPINPKFSILPSLLEREPELLTALSDFLQKIKTPKIDAIAVTYGPGLEPALWVGINFARALSLVWEKPIIPINHMEGHIFSALLSGNDSKLQVRNPNAPALALLISGGHTEIILIKKLFQYKVVGETRDDAVGEAFDKAARILGLPYPGGPEISLRAEKFRKQFRTGKKTPSSLYKLPRPMIHSDDFDFSFSGIKTAVLYMVKKIENMTEEIREEICYEFEEAVTETLLSKTIRATEKYLPKTVIIGGGVTANIHIQKSFTETFKNQFPDIEILTPKKYLTGDNALMIAVAGYMRMLHNSKKMLEPNGRKIKVLRADGNLSL